MDLFSIAFVIAVIVFSVIVHEVMHGVAADSLGDPTARYAGRLTLNPIPHIDFIGSIVLPIICALTPGGFLFGWAKPVPYNPYNLVRAPIWGEAIVAVAGPASNLALALIFGLLIRLQAIPSAADLFMYVVAVNVSLTILNLLPIPPLDGSKIFSAILPKSFGYDRLREQLERNPLFGFGLVIVLIVVFGETLGTLSYALSRMIVGM